MLKAWIGADFDRVMLGVFPFLARVRMSPDTLTTVGVVISFLAGAGFALGELVWAGVLMGVAGFFDLIDGVVARAQGSSSPSGAFYDSSMDRLSDLFVFSGIAVGMAADADPWGVALLCWAMIGAVMTSYTRARAEKHLASLDAGFMERGERVVVLMLGALSGWLRVALTLVALGATLTAIQRVVLARRLLRELEASGRDPTLQPEPVVEG